MLVTKTNVKEEGVTMVEAGYIDSRVAGMFRAIVGSTRSHTVLSITPATAM